MPAPGTTSRERSRRPTFRPLRAATMPTDTVDVVVGEMSEEGAAGSVYFQVPVAVRALRAGGPVEVFAGCYTVRQVNAVIQEPPFLPLQIEGGNFKP